jgi:methionyl-tRNA synthetase
VNAELANSFGNLAQRTLSMIYKNLDGVIPAPGEAPEDRELLRSIDEAIEDLTRRFEDFAFSTGLEAWMGAVFACNAYVDAAAPWALRKTDPGRMAEVLGTLVVAIRKLAEAVVPVIPASAGRLIGTIDDGLQGGLTRLFQSSRDWRCRRKGRRARRREADR